MFTNEENFSKAKLLCVVGLEMITASPARPEEVGAASSFTVRIRPPLKVVMRFGVFCGMKRGEKNTAPL